MAPRTQDRIIHCLQCNKEVQIKPKSIRRYCDVCIKNRDYLATKDPPDLPDYMIEKIIDEYDRKVWNFSPKEIA